ncbi:hypothetical protein QQF64_025499 [Cirrhinus molitorella]|uniref:NAD(P)(+)--arginine ADP-ribosyltransferase n=1 Tax=Cirrhinus molitorella TaxID=172907 RepID=A0ABR3NQC9_9TELE
MLQIIKGLLLILAALEQDHRAAVEEQIFPLDMAPNSVDDQYEGCTEKMRNLVETKYLEKETSQPESAEVTKYSIFPIEQEVLIPPYETFKVTAVNTKIYQKDLWCETVYSLKSTGKKSELNCTVH